MSGRDNTRPTLLRAARSEGTPACVSYMQGSFPAASASWRIRAAPIATNCWSSVTVI